MVYPFFGTREQRLFATEDQSVTIDDWDNNMDPERRQKRLDRLEKELSKVQAELESATDCHDIQRVQAVKRLIGRLNRDIVMAIVDQ